MINNTEGSYISEVEQQQINPLDLFVSSIDTLRHTSIDHTVPPNSGWAARPARYHLSSSTDGDRREDIKVLCRRGVPPCLRCATWIINVFANNSDKTNYNNNYNNTSSDALMTQSEAEEYGTLSKVRILDHGWNLVLASLFPDASDVDRADVLDFGVGNDHLVNILIRDHGGEIDEKGIKSLTLLMHGIRDSLGVEFCPLMPDLCCLLLSHMPVSEFAFCW